MSDTTGPRNIDEQGDPRGSGAATDASRSPQNAEARQDATNTDASGERAEKPASTGLGDPSAGAPADAEDDTDPAEDDSDDSDDAEQGPRRHPGSSDVDADRGSAERLEPDAELNRIGRGTSAEPESQLP